jgi:hypothetical protein
MSTPVTCRCGMTIFCSGTLDVGDPIICGGCGRHYTVGIAETGNEKQEEDI